MAEVDHLQTRGNACVVGKGARDLVLDGRVGRDDTSAVKNGCKAFFLSTLRAHRLQEDPLQELVRIA